jgi:hypothetical protein
MWRSGEKFVPYSRVAQIHQTAVWLKFLRWRLISVRSSGWNLRLLAPRILRWLLYFGKICVPLIHSNLGHTFNMHSLLFWILHGPDVYCTDPQSASIYTWRHTPRSEVTRTCKSLKIRRIKIFLKYNLYRHATETTIFLVLLVCHTEGKT